MKQFDLIYNPNEDEERYIFSNIDFDKLGSSIHVQREEPPQEETYDFGKKKSEIVEYESEEYKKLKDIEQFPLIISDNESKAYSGKLNNISDIGNKYFAFINMGSYLKVIPISKWYGFVQKNQLYVDNVDLLDKKLEIVHEAEESNSEPDIDYEDNFDDDDENDKVVQVWKEKKLNSYGKKIKGLMDNYEKEKKSNVKEEKDEESIIITEETIKEENKRKKVKISNELTKDKLNKMIGTSKISIKDLLKNVKQNYNLGEDEKKMIREFIYESCTFEIDSVTGEKHFKLKK